MGKRIKSWLKTAHMELLYTLNTKQSVLKAAQIERELRSELFDEVFKRSVR